MDRLDAASPSGNLMCSLSWLTQIFIKVTFTLAPELLKSAFNVGDGHLKSLLVPGLGGFLTTIEIQ
jgi:hypothetical protein